DAGTTDVLVTQGKVKVSGYGGLVHSGRQLACGRGPDRLTTIPRASHELGWTRELVAAGASPLVPASEHKGGALIALDPTGQEAKLSLREYHVDVHVEDGFARTTIDQTYFNHMHSRLEGTFYFPLPPDASISRLAMYVNGKLMEGGMAERAHARYVFEDIMHTRRDPALLEWVDGSTFKMRVFPLEPRQEKRIVLSYTQRLSTVYGRTEYRFPGGHSMELVGRWSFHGRVVGGADLKWASPTHELTGSKDGGDLIVDFEQTKVMPKDDLVLHVFEQDFEATATELARFSTADHEKHRYLMVRFRPELETKADAARQRRDWLFVFESSGDRDPLLARAQIEVIRGLLDHAEPDDRFAVLTAGTHVRNLFSTLQPVTGENVAAATAFLDTSHLVGALDLEGALSAAGEMLADANNAHLVHVGTGIAVLGERRTDKLIAMIPLGTRYVGIGVGKRWARSFMKEAAAATGGFFTQINPDQNVPWRTFETASTLNASRLMDIKVSGAGPDVRFLTFADSIADGEEICAVARLDGTATGPGMVEITGTLDGKAWSRELSVEDPSEGADYLPRFWAKLQIDRLVAANAAANRNAIVKLSKAMYVMSPFTSLLVLENDAMYAQYKVDRGRKDHWALYPAPKTIPVVREPAKTPAPPTEAKAGKPTAKDVLESILVCLPPEFVQWGDGRDYRAGQVVSAWSILTGRYRPPARYTNAVSSYFMEVGGTNWATTQPTTIPWSAGAGTYEGL
ncbi:MAG: VIT and vWA domain-containing protein, partial [Planctomycetota bacterium]